MLHYKTHNGKKLATTLTMDALTWPAPPVSPRMLFLLLVVVAEPAMDVVTVALPDAMAETVADTETSPKETEGYQRVLRPIRGNIGQIKTHSKVPDRSPTGDVVNLVI